MRRTVLILLSATIIGAAAIYAWMGIAGKSPYRQDKLEIPDSPPGTSTPEWKPISSELGIYVQKLSTGKVVGYLMVRTGGQWKPVDLYDPEKMGVLPAR